MKPPAHHGTTAKHAPSKHAPAHPAHGKHKAAPPKHTAKKAPAKKAKAPVAKTGGPAKPAKPRKLSLGAVACCPAEAVAAAARIAGWMVSDQDVLDLYARVADGPSSGFTIAAALTAASGWGLPIEFGALAPDGCDLGLQFTDRAGVAADMQRVDVAAVWARPVADLAGLGDPRADVVRGQPAEPVGNGGHALILGADLPGPHAVTVAPDGTWWSWGEPFDPDGWPGMVIEEAWAVSFA